jgi:hypothetical protein
LATISERFAGFFEMKSIPISNTKELEKPSNFHTQEMDAGDGLL